jgi:phosphate transport system protein
VGASVATVGVYGRVRASQFVDLGAGYSCMQGLRSVHGRVAMGEARRRFHEQLRGLEDDVQRIGAQAQQLLATALQGLSGGDIGICEEVVKGDDAVDELYLEVEQRILQLFALQTPVASDLRLLTGLLHINLHLERIADQAVNLAKITCLADGLPRNLEVLRRLEEMGARVVGMVDIAMQALARRDLELAPTLPELDDPVDELNRGMLKHVMVAAHNSPVLEWGIRMYVVSRQLERVGDNAVDIGEQVAFVISGRFQEFTDASHPEVEHPELLTTGT